MPVAVRHAPRSIDRGRRRAAAGAALAGATLVGLLPLTHAHGDIGAPTHLVVSEIVTGGTSASDELIEIHNPSASPLPLDGLEVVYVSASGATTSRRAAWGLGAGNIEAHGHLLVANDAGIYAPIADATYTSGMASTGGSVAIRIEGATTAIDAVGWGTTTSTWREGLAEPAPAAGASIERLPGGALGSGQDTDDNETDFALRLVPDPQNLSSPPAPGGGPLETTAPTPPAGTPAPTPGPTVLTIGAARSLPDGSTATVEGFALAGSDFHDGGGFVADASGGIAVLVTDGAFPRGVRLRLTGELDDRFAQRTLRVDGADVVVLGAGADPAPISGTTGGVGEAVEGRLVRIGGVIAGAGSVLTSGIAFDVDDGSGVTRVVVGSGTDIDASAWGRGTHVGLAGVVGQRDSSGEGLAGYRVMPRDPADVTLVAPPATPEPGASSTPGASNGPEPTADPAGVSSIATARASAKNARLSVRGVVTLAPGIVDSQTAAIQDASGAIVLRLGGEVGRLALGERVEVRGTRSTKSGMETLRVTEPATHLGQGPMPSARSLRTGDAGEAHEATLVTIRGALAASARRSSTGSVTFDVDDGSGPLKVAVGAALELDPSAFASGTWVEVTGVLGQVTTGAQPGRGYRLWPRTSSEVRVVAAATGGGAAGSGVDGAGAGSATAGSLDRIGIPNLEELTIGATLVVGPWPELDVGGLLWDGRRLVAIDARSAGIVATVLGDRRPPLALQLSGLRAAGKASSLGIPRVVLGTEAGDVLPAAGQPIPPRPLASVAKPGWATAVGRIAGAGTGMELHLSGATVRVDQRCDAGRRGGRGGLVGVTGVAIGSPTRLIAPCDAIVTAPVADARELAAPVAAASRAISPLGEPGAIDARRILAGALLAFAAIGLGGLAGLRSWSERAHRAQPGTTVAESGAVDPAAGPRLALVRLPREPSP